MPIGQNRGEAVLAYVVSDVQEDGTVVGYEGVVANMTTNAEKGITSILLDSCEIFYLRVSQRGVARRKAERDSNIGQLYLDRSHIRIDHTSGSITHQECGVRTREIRRP